MTWGLAHAQRTKYTKNIAAKLKVDHNFFNLDQKVIYEPFLKYFKVITIRNIHLKYCSKLTSKKHMKLHQLPNLSFRPGLSLFKGLVELGVDGLSTKPWQWDHEMQSQSLWCNIGWWSYNRVFTSVVWVTSVGKNKTNHQGGSDGPLYEWVQLWTP